MPKKPKVSAKTVEIDWDKLRSKIDDEIDSFEGDITEFERAVGALMVGQYFGWKVLRVIHAGQTYAKYEKTLHLKFAEWCEPEGALAYRSRGLQIVKKLGEFWDVIKAANIGPEAEKKRSVAR